MKKFLRVFVVLALVSSWAGFTVRAQQTSGVSGVVTDNTGGAISGVTVTLDNQNLGIHVSTTTNDNGYYQFIRLNPASGFELTFTKDGFRKLVLSSITLGISTVETRNATLEVGTVTQSVEVQAS